VVDGAFAQQIEAGAARLRRRAGRPAFELTASKLRHPLAVPGSADEFLDRRSTP